MTESEFRDFRSFSVTNYAKALVRNLRLTYREALDAAQRESNEELPQGFYSEGHYFYHVHQPQTDKRIGYAWVYINQKRKSAFLYDIWIEEAHRGKGFAAKTIQAISEICQGFGVKALRLNVFEDNKQAKQLYEKLGFEPCNTIMQRLL